MDKSGIILLALIFVCKEGLACNPGWKESNGKCYRITVFSYDIRMARRYCQIYGGDLAYIGSNQNFSFLRTLEHYETYDFWVKENSTIVDSGRPIPTEEPNGCPYVTGEQFLFSNCEIAKYFICEVEDNAELSCPTTWYLYGTTCYKPMPDNITYDMAEDVCAIQRGSLAIMDDIVKEHQMAAVILGWNTTFLVGAQVINGTLQWRNGKQFLPSCPQCVVNSTGECLGFQSSAVHPVLFSWVHLNCNSTNNYVCEIPPSLKSTTVPTTVPPTVPTTLPPLQCPYGYNWKSHDASGFCYWETTYETKKLNWYEARTFCKSVGGDLATYVDQAQESVGLGGAKGHYRGLWFGLKRSQDNVFSWVDGSPLTYTNWDFREPNLNSSTMFCAVHAGDDSSWRLDYCGVRRWFICKAPKTRRVVITDKNELFEKTRCNFTSSSFLNWYLFEDHCYVARESSSYSWYMAQNFCQDNNAHLLSVHSFEETDFVISLVSSISNKGYWMGLSARGIDSALEWSDGSPLDFFYWPDGDNPNDTFAGVDVCVNFNSYSGYWTREHCNTFATVICKRPMNSSNELIKPEPTPALPGNCPRNWYQFGNKCYRVYGTFRSQRLNYIDAWDSCKSEGADLVSIHSDEEQDFLVDLLLLTNSGVWIGLHTDPHSRRNYYQWTDGSPLDYTNWFQTSGVNKEMCVELKNGNNWWRWDHSMCSNAKAYICQKPKEPSLTEPSENPFQCSNITGWYKLGNICYGIFETKELESSWVAAQRKCRESDADLLTFQNDAVGSFLKKRLTRKDNFLWIGVRETMPNEYGLVNGFHLKKSNWMLMQPVPVASHMENCVAINSEAKWVVKECREPHSFICEWNMDSTKEESDVAEEQPPCSSPNLMDLGGDACYLFRDSIPVSWVEAMQYCFSHGAHLASFHSEKELNLVRDHLKQEFESDVFFIGLGKRHDGSFAWVDGSPVDFSNWRDTHVDSLACTEMSVVTGLWQVSSCSVRKRTFICSNQKHKTVQEAARDSYKPLPIQEEDISNKLTIGGIFGIIICLLVVATIIGVTAYYTCPSTRMRVRLEETDSL